MNPQTTAIQCALLLLVANSAACTTYRPLDEMCTEASQYPATLTAGTGTTVFEDITEDMLISPAFGFQGGHHIWTSVQTTGVNPGQGEMVNPNTDLDGGFSLEPVGQAPVTIDTQIHLEGDLVGPYPASFTNFLDGSGESAQLLGLTAFIDMWGISEAYSEQDTVAASMEVTITDGCDTVATDSRAFVMQIDGISGLD